MGSSYRRALARGVAGSIFVGVQVVCVRGVTTHVPTTYRGTGCLPPSSAEAAACGHVRLYSHTVHHTTLFVRL